MGDVGLFGSPRYLGRPINEKWCEGRVRWLPLSDVVDEARCMCCVRCSSVCVVNRKYSLLAHACVFLFANKAPPPPPPPPLGRFPAARLPNKAHSQSKIVSSRESKGSNLHHLRAAVLSCLGVPTSARDVWWRGGGGELACWRTKRIGVARDDRYTPYRQLSYFYSPIFFIAIHF